MHNAPPVTYPVGRSRFQAGAQGALWLLGVATVAGWCWQVDALGWRQGAAALAVVGAGLLAVFGWWKTPAAALRWDGQQWFWTANDVARTVHVSAHLDLQHHLLLRLRPDAGRPLWCWPKGQASLCTGAVCAVRYIRPPDRKMNPPVRSDLNHDCTTAP